MLKEFGDFVKRGNVMDLAVAVILGGAFGAIVKSLVDDILMPILSILTGGIDFSNLFIALDGGDYATLAAAQEAGAATLNYGLFINAVINFLVIAFTIFMIVRQINKMQKPAPAVPGAPPEPSAEEKLLTEIRDLLAKK
ncbi:MAG: large conductance mechanosensitive channel protein MscL [Chloroflexi bacterium]|nr:large conductance mechanosensitive channel protein MscL [Chloroflexota bacterium]